LTHAAVVPAKFVAQSSFLAAPCRVTGQSEATQEHLFGHYVSGVSLHGEHLVIGHEGINLIPLNLDKNDILIYFVERGEVVKTLTVSELVTNRSSRKRTASHLLWGSYLGIDEDGHFGVEQYVGDQLGHHRMGDSKVQQRLARFQKSYPDVDLTEEVNPTDAAAAPAAGRKPCFGVAFPDSCEGLSPS
jgi:hypothetical protein